MTRYAMRSEGGNLAVSNNLRLFILHYLQRIKLLITYA